MLFRFVHGFPDFGLIVVHGRPVSTTEHSVLVADGQLKLELSRASRCENAHNLGSVIGTNVGCYFMI